MSIGRDNFGGGRFKLFAYQVGHDIAVVTIGAVGVRLYRTFSHEPYAGEITDAERLQRIVRDAKPLVRNVNDDLRAALEYAVLKLARHLERLPA